MNFYGLCLILFLSYGDCYSFGIEIKKNETLIHDVTYSLFHASDFPMVAHVVKLDLSNRDVKLVPALGQREEVSSIATRSTAFIAINGSNYRRGGNGSIGVGPGLCQESHHRWFFVKICNFKRGPTIRKISGI